ncbi:hypothetical protein [Pseudoxanthomonas suwonensis]
MSHDKSGDRDDEARRGEQPGKHESRDRNDPEVQPGARTGRKEPPYVNPEPPRGPGEG